MANVVTHFNREFKRPEKKKKKKGKDTETRSANVLDHMLLRIRNTYYARSVITKYWKRLNCYYYRNNNTNAGIPTPGI